MRVLLHNSQGQPTALRRPEAIIFLYSPETPSPIQTSSPPNSPLSVQDTFPPVPIQIPSSSVLALHDHVGLGDFATRFRGGSSASLFGNHSNPPYRPPIHAAGLTATGYDPQPPPRHLTTCATGFTAPGYSPPPPPPGTKTARHEGQTTGSQSGRETSKSHASLQTDRQAHNPQNGGPSTGPRPSATRFEPAGVYTPRTAPASPPTAPTALRCTKGLSPLPMEADFGAGRPFASCTYALGKGGPPETILLCRTRTASTIRPSKLRRPNNRPRHSAVQRPEPGSSPTTTPSDSGADSAIRLASPDERRPPGARAASCVAPSPLNGTIFRRDPFTPQLWASLPTLRQQTHSNAPATGQLVPWSAQLFLCEHPRSFSSDDRGISPCRTVQPLYGQPN